MRTLLFSIGLLIPWILQSQCATGTMSVIRSENPMANSTGPFCPGETIQFCYDIVFSSDPTGTGNNCAWIQGIVPKLGNGWDLSSFDPVTNSPTNFNWEIEGRVDYNYPNASLGTYTNSEGWLALCHDSESNCTNSNYLNTGDLLPRGWWSVSPGGTGCINDGDPDNMWGFPMGCGSDLTISTCFDLTTKEDVSNCSTYLNEDYDLTFYVFSDGETGCWSASSCSVYDPISFEYEVSCECNLTVVEGNSDCPTTRALSNAYLGTGTYEASISVSATNSAVYTSENVIIRAGDNICLDNGFTVYAGSDFEAKIEDCSN